MDAKAEWQSLAEALGFEFKEGINALLESDRVQKVAFEDYSKNHQSASPEFLKNPLIQGMLSKLFLGMITGIYEDFEFLLYRSSSSSSSNTQNKTYYSNCVLMFKRSYEFGMEVVPATFWSRLGKKLFSGKYVKIHHPELDQMLSIKGKNKHQVQTLLSNGDLQVKLLELYKISDGFKITDHGIRFKEPGHVFSRERALELMKLMAEAAGKFY